MAGREDLGSWLEGGPREEPSGRGRQVVPEGRTASLGRRLVALVVDWVLAQTVSWAFFTERTEASEGPVAVFLDANEVATLLVFAVSTAVLVGTSGGTIGHRLLGLRVARAVDLVRESIPEPATATAPATGTGPATAPVAEPAPGLVPALARTALLCLVIPAVVWDATGRGLHDVVAGTAIVRR